MPSVEGVLYPCIRVLSVNPCLSVIQIALNPACPPGLDLSDDLSGIYRGNNMRELFIGQYAADLSEQFNLAHLVADKSLFKARWHQVDRKAGKVATLMPWSKSVIMAGSMVNFTMTL